MTERNRKQYAGSPAGPYDDIIGLPHPVSHKHPQMPRKDRAAQFAPFAALTGYEAAVRETERLTDDKIQLSEEEKAVLDQTLQTILRQPGPGVEITVTWFIPDTKKSGGSYRTAAGIIKKADAFEQCILLQDGTRIPMDDILEIRIQTHVTD